MAEAWQRSIAYCIKTLMISTTKKSKQQQYLPISMLSFRFDQTDHQCSIWVDSSPIIRTCHPKLLKHEWSSLSYEHNALNRRANGQCGLPLYSLIELLDREARLTAVTIRLVSDQKLKRMQRKLYRSLQAKLFDVWEQYDNHKKTAIQLIKACSHLNGPARAQWSIIVVVF